jgi:NAD(P)H-hydrate epimerase
VIPILTAAEMAAVDADAKEPVEVLIERAGHAVARRVLAMLGGSYGRRVVVVAGKGNNGADGRSAARRLARRGVHVVVIAAAAAPERLPRADLVIDAAYGTGFRGDYRAPDPGAALVLAVDIPSGVNGDTGVACDGAVRADATVTFAALKPGLLLNDGPDLAGEIELVDIGLAGDETAARWVTARLLELVPRKQAQDTKFSSGSVLVVGGSRGMSGAVALAACCPLAIATPTSGAARCM